MALLRSDDLMPVAARIAAEVRERLASLLPAYELVHTGGTSVPGALTKGDVDLHLRVAPTDFAATVGVLRGLYRSVHPEIWQDTLATFAVEASLPTGIAVTPIGSEHDVRFRRSWELLRADPRLLARYNAMKQGGDYEDRKSAFFDSILAGDPTA